MQRNILAAVVVGLLVAAVGRAEAADKSRAALEEELVVARLVIALQRARVEQLEAAARPTAAPKGETPDARKTRKELVAQIQVLRTERDEATRAQHAAELRLRVVTMSAGDVALLKAQIKKHGDRIAELINDVHHYRSRASSCEAKLKRAGIPLPR